MRVAAPATATAARRRAVLEAELRVVSESAKQRFASFVEVEADKAAAIAAAADAATGAPPAEAAKAQAQLAEYRAAAQAEAAAMESAAAEELIEEEPLLRVVLRKGGIEQALELSALQETATKARVQMAAAEDEELQRRFERMPAHPDRQRPSQGGASDNMDTTRRHSGVDSSGRSRGAEARERESDLRRRVERAEQRARTLAGAGVMAYEETVRLARAFLLQAPHAHGHRGLYNLALELRRGLRDLEDGAASSPLKPPKQRLPPPPPTRPQQADASAATMSAAAPVGHVCTCACAKLVCHTPLERALLAQLKHLMVHCKGSGVSAFPAPLARQPLGDCHTSNGCTTAGASSSGASADVGDSLLVWACTVVAPADTPLE